MRITRRVITPFLCASVLASAAVPIVSGAAGDASVEPCTTRGSKTLQATDTARVFVKREKIYACLYSTGSPVALGPDGRLCEAPCGGVAAVAIGGRFVAFSSYASTRQVIKSYVDVRDLRTGKVRRIWQGGDLTPGAGVTTVEGLVISRAGVVGWLARFDTDVEIHSTASGRDEVLDSANSIAPGSLALAGGTMYWLHAGQARSASLN